MSEKVILTELNEPTVDQVLAAIPGPLVPALAREKRSGLRKTIVLADGRLLCITVSRRRRAKVRIVRPVPDEVARLTDAFQRIYLGLRTCRQITPEDQEVTAVHVCEKVGEQVEGELALATVYRGLKKLVTINEVRKSETTGYHLGKHTATLAFSDSHSELPVQRAETSVESVTVN